MGFMVTCCNITYGCAAVDKPITIIIIIIIIIIYYYCHHYYYRWKPLAMKLQKPLKAYYRIDSISFPMDGGVTLEEWE